MPLLFAATFGSAGVDAQCHQQNEGHALFRAS
jgi:hypothetical protein